MKAERLKDLQASAKKLAGQGGHVNISTEVFCELVAAASQNAETPAKTTTKK